MTCCSIRKSPALRPRLPQCMRAFNAWPHRQLWSHSTQRHHWTHRTEDHEVALELWRMALDPSSGYVAANNLLDVSANALPIFNVERVQLQFSIASDFVAAQVANNVLILALSNGRILRIDLDNAADIDGIISLITLQMLLVLNCASQMSIFPRRPQKLVSSSAFSSIPQHHIS